MKKIFPIFMIVILLILSAGCSNTEQNNNSSKNESNNNTPQNSETYDKESETVDKNEEKAGKVLVVYYSATGTTENVAKSIADYTGADTFEIRPLQEYTSDDLDWTNDNARVVAEHNNPDNRNVELVATNPENFEEYDTIFIGYPIWWGIAAWPVDNFVKENDFTGKTVIPFCTAISSDIGESGDLLAEMAGTGKWQEGKRFYGNSTTEEIHDWIDSLEY